MICHRSTCSPGLSSCLAQNGGGSIFVHPARHGRRAVRMRDVEGRVGDRLVADAAGMDVGLVRQVHQVVDDEAVVAFQAVEGAALADPFGAVVPVEIRDLGRIGQSGIAGPDPDEPMPLGDRIGADAGGRIDGLLRRHVGAAPGGIEDEPMIAADHLVAFEAPHGERQQPVPAGVLERRHLPVGAAIENHVLVADRPRGELVLDLMAPGRGIPSIQGKGVGVRHRVFSLIQTVYRQNCETTILAANAGRGRRKAELWRSSCIQKNKSAISRWRSRSIAAQLDLAAFTGSLTFCVVANSTL